MARTPARMTVEQQRERLGADHDAVRMVQEYTDAAVAVYGGMIQDYAQNRGSDWIDSRQEALVEWIDRLEAATHVREPELWAYAIQTQVMNMTASLLTLDLVLADPDGNWGHSVGKGWSAVGRANNEFKARFLDELER